MYICIYVYMYIHIYNYTYTSCTHAQQVYTQLPIILYTHMNTYIDLEVVMICIYYLLYYIYIYIIYIYRYIDMMNCSTRYTASLSMVGFVLEAISALFCLCALDAEKGCRCREGSLMAGRQEGSQFSMVHFDCYVYVYIYMYICIIPVEIFVTKSEASGPLQNGFWLPFCAKFWPWVLPSCKWTPPWYRNLALKVRVWYPPVPTFLQESGGLINNHYKLDGFKA